ncbi:MAG: hypothetical protein DMF73_18485, partial [Acidobacteria bacterium]
MNEEPTRNLSDHRSFEERVFARFDAVDARLEKLESRNYDTKPIWERALKEIVETQRKVDDLRTTVEAIEIRVGAIEIKVDAIEIRVAAIEAQLETLRSDYASMHHEL